MKRTYSHLSDEECRKLEQWRHAKISPDVIAERLGRHRSTIYRELKRNHFRDEAMPKVVGYFWMVARMKAAVRRAKERKLIRHAELQGQVIDRIKAGWTPEQIAGRMRFEGAKPRVCQETIYRFVYSKEGMQHDLWWYLPEHRRKRRPRRARKRQAPKFRPDDVAHRRQFGHWEADLVLFRQKFGPNNLTSLVERISRFTVLLPNADRRTRPIMAKLVAVLGSLPFKARRSVTFDRGSEFIDWPHLQAGAGVRPGSATRARPGRKARSRTPTAACGAG